MRLALDRLIAERFPQPQQLGRQLLEPATLLNLLAVEGNLGGVTDPARDGLPRLLEGVQRIGTTLATLPI